MTFCVQESSLHPTIKSCDVSIFSFSRNQRPSNQSQGTCVSIRAPDERTVNHLGTKAFYMKHDTVKTTAQKDANCYVGCRVHRRVQ